MVFFAFSLGKFIHMLFPCINAIPPELYAEHAKHADMQSCPKALTSVTYFTCCCLGMSKGDTNDPSLTGLNTATPGVNIERLFKQPVIMFLVSVTKTFSFIWC